MLLGLARHAGFQKAEATVLHLAADYVAAMSQLLVLPNGPQAAFNYITSVLTNTKLDAGQRNDFGEAVRDSIASLTEVGSGPADPLHNIYHADLCS